MRRVVITSMGIVSPLGFGIEHNWNSIVNSVSGINKVTRCDLSAMECQIAGEIPFKDGTGGDVYGDFEHSRFEADLYMEKKDQRRVDPFIIYAMAAASEAFDNSGLDLSEEEQLRAGVLIGSGIGGLKGIAEGSILLNEKGHKRISPFFIPGRLINLATGYVSIKYGLKGPNHSVVTACSTGSHAIGDAYRLIKYGDADIMLAGGAESAICPIGIAGFLACKALSTSFNDRPETASRPYDKHRDGFVMGEGAGVVLLEEYEYAKKRGANILAEVIGYGLSGDAFHITAPSEDGNGGFRSMEAALKNAQCNPENINYVNAHGTSTPLGDEIELRAVERIFKNNCDNLLMSSTKSSTGHLLGAAGAIEAIYSVLAMRDNIAPPTLNLCEPSVETKINLCPLKPVEGKIDYVMSNSFGFGGTNATLVMKRI